MIKICLPAAYARIGHDGQGVGLRDAPGPGLGQDRAAIAFQVQRQVNGGDQVTFELPRTLADDRRGYTGVLDHLLAGLGSSRPLAEVSGEELAGLLEQLWGRRAPATWNRNRGAVAAWLSCMAKTRHRNPRTAMRYVRPGAEAVAEVTALLEPPRRRG